MMFVTGDVMSPHTCRFLEESRISYFEKPFGIKGFQGVIRWLLDHGERPAVKPATGA